MVCKKLNITNYRSLAFQVTFCLQKVKLYKLSVACFSNDFCLQKAIKLLYFFDCNLINEDKNMSKTNKNNFSCLNDFKKCKNKHILKKQRLNNEKN